MTPVKPVKEMSYQELQGLAKELGVEKVAGVSKAALIAEIEKRQGGEQPPADHKPGLLERAASAVAHVFVPPAAESGANHEAATAVLNEQVDKSSSQKSDLAKHPKFAKFKSQGDNQP